MDTQSVADRMEQIVNMVVLDLVDSPDEVVVSSAFGLGSELSSMTISVRVLPNEIGQVVGKKGSIIQSLRKIIEAIAAKNKIHVHVTVVDGRRGRGG